MGDVLERIEWRGFMRALMVEHDQMSETTWMKVLGLSQIEVANLCEGLEPPSPELLWRIINHLCDQRKFDVHFLLAQWEQRRVPASWVVMHTPGIPFSTLADYLCRPSLVRLVQSLTGLSLQDRLNVLRSATNAAEHVSQK